MKNKMSAVATENLANFFLVVGNGNTLETLRGLIDELGRGTTLEAIFEKVVAHARIKADKEEDPFSRFKNWATIASQTGADEDLAMVEDLLPEIQSPNQRGMAKKLFVKVLAKAGHLEDAATVAGNIRSAYWRAEAYLERWKVVGGTADIDRASEAVEHIISSDAKEEVLAQIRAARHKK